MASFSLKRLGFRQSEHRGRNVDGFAAYAPSGNEKGPAQPMVAQAPKSDRNGHGGV